MLGKNSLSNPRWDLLIWCRTLASCREQIVEQTKAAELKSVFLFTGGQRINVCSSSAHIYIWSKLRAANTEINTRFCWRLKQVWANLHPQWESRLSETCLTCPWLQKHVHTQRTRVFPETMSLCCFSFWHLSHLKLMFCVHAVSLWSFCLCPSVKTSRTKSLWKEQPTCLLTAETQSLQKKRRKVQSTPELLLHHTWAAVWLLKTGAFMPQFWIHFYYFALYNEKLSLSFRKHSPSFKKKQ